MNKRQKKKLEGTKCPECNSKNGIYGTVVENQEKMNVFLYCAKCEYDIMSVFNKGIKNDEGDK